MREQQFDLLRVLCAFAVVVMHVSAQFIAANKGQDSYCLLYSLLYATVFRFAVPCFIMLSGAFILSNSKNANFLYFYKKSFLKFFVPVFFFSFLYYVYSNLLILLRHTLIQQPEFLTVENFLIPLLEWFKGEPFYHLWYMYTLIGLYCVAPIIVRLRQDIGVQTFSKVAWTLLFVNCILAWGKDEVVYWDLAYVINYIGYFMVGCCIRDMIGREGGNNLGFVLFITLGLIFEVIAAFGAYWQFSGSEMIIATVFPSWTSNHSPLIVLSSVLIFWGFSLLKINRSFSFLSGLTFVTYLVHAGLLQILQILSGKNFFNIYSETDSPILSIPIITLITFLLSMFAAYIYKISKIDIWMEFIAEAILKKYSVKRHPSEPLK